MTASTPLDQAWNYPLFESLYRRCSRRFGLGFFYGGKMDLRLVNVVWGNDVTGPRGRILERRPQGERTRAEVEAWCEKSDGTKTIVGSASALEL